MTFPRRHLEFTRLVFILVLAAAVQDQPFAAEAAETVLSNQMCKGLFLVPLSWTSKRGSRHELTAVFDTGGSSLFIDPDSLERISGKRIAAGARVRLEDVSAGERSFSRFRPRVRNLDHLSRALGKSLDVFLPFRSFDGLLLTLDYPKGELRVSPGALPEPDGIVVFSARGPDRRPWLSIRVGSKPLLLLVDSGATGSLSLDPGRGVNWVHSPLPLRFFQGMNEAGLRSVGRLDAAVEIGPLTFEDPIVSLTDDTEWIGFEILRHFVVTFDQKNRRLRLRSSTESPIRLASKRGIGALFRPVPEGYEVIHILDGSPADLAGLEVQDLVTHIDGTPVTKLGCRSSSDSKLKKKLRIRRDNQTFEVTLESTVLLP